MAAVRRRVPVRPLAGILPLLVCSFVSCSHSANSSRRLASSDVRASHSDVGQRLVPTRTGSCPMPTGGGGGGASHSGGNPEARAAAQRGLTFVAQEAASWQRSHNCYGCHVQAVTFEALTVGRSHQYEVSRELFDFVRSGLLDVPGGHRHQGGLSVGGSGMPATSRAFGGAAFARYDALAGDDLRDDLLGVAGQLIEIQNEDGSLRVDDTRFPVVAGPLQAATQAMQTWRQAYSRTADERWIAPLRRTEAWMQREARALTDAATNNNVHLNYAVMGLLAAGAQPSEAAMRNLESRLRTRQRADGGWGLTDNDESNAFATGQTLHALRSLGAADTDAVIARGTSWLIEHQGTDGGWSHSGRGKAEAMWAVFGLVSIDRISINVTGVRDGQHADGTLAIEANAVDNQRAAMREVVLLVDDVPVERSCAATMRHGLDVSRLAAGVHQIDVVATNAEGQSTRRRVEFYTGAHYLTRTASQWVRDATEITLRNVAPASVGGRVRVQVRPEREGAAQVWESSVASVEGPMSFRWEGRNAGGEAQPRGRYVATVEYLDARGQGVQRVEVPFVHDTAEAQREQFAQVAGQIQVDGSRGAANTAVELVDREGRVVARTSTTEQGNYQFRNVDAGNYRVRVRRSGFRASEQAVSATRGAAAPARPAAAMQLNLE